MRVSGDTAGMGRAPACGAHCGYDMAIIFYNRAGVGDAELSWAGPRQCDTLDELLATSDVVSLHCPGGAENLGLIDGARIAAMRPHTFLVNTARGDVVDEDALVEALENGRIAGAGLDVFVDETTISERL